MHSPTSLRSQHVNASRAATMMPAVRNIARRIARRVPSRIMLDDLISAGSYGLAEAIHRYRPVPGCCFEAYALRRIEGEMLDELRRRDVLSRPRRALARRCDAAASKLRNAGGEPSETDLAKAVGIGVDELRRLRTDDQSRTRAYDSCDDARDDAAMALMATQASRPDQEVQVRDGLRQLQSGLDQLSPKQRTAVVMFFLQDRTLKEIGETLGVTESRACQLRTEGVNQLRRWCSPRVRPSGRTRGTRHSMWPQAPRPASA